jgi:hypothetical protein
MLKVVVLPALGTNRANVQVMDGNDVVATLDVIEVLGKLKVTTRMYDGNAQTFERSQFKAHLKDLSLVSVGEQLPSFVESPEYSQEAAAATIDETEKNLDELLKPYGI